MNSCLLHFVFYCKKEIVVGEDMNRIFIVMDYVEHDLKGLMTHTMKKPFSIGEVKTLMYQLLSGVNHLHDNWIIHRDLKTSNLLLSNKGILKVCRICLSQLISSPFCIILDRRFWFSTRIWITVKILYTDCCYTLVSSTGIIIRNQSLFEKFH